MMKNIKALGGDKGRNKPPGTVFLNLNISDLQTLHQDESVNKIIPEVYILRTYY